ncbi:hypothetical protein Trydic_g23000 [Trypoxylus dichotomus]
MNANGDCFSRPSLWPTIPSPFIVKNAGTETEGHSIKVAIEVPQRERITYHYSDYTKDGSEECVGHFDYPLLRFDCRPIDG